MRRAPLDSPAGIVAVLAAFTLAVAAWFAWLLGRPHALDWDEVQLRELAALWRSGVLPYTDLSRLPAVFNPWGPIYTGLAALGDTAADTFYRHARLLSALATAATVAIVASASGDRRWRVACALLLLTTRPYLNFGCRARVDALMILFCAGAVVLAFSAPRPRSLVAAGVLLGIGSGVKLSCIAAPVAIVGWLVASDRRRVGWFLVPWVLVAGGIIAAMQHATGGAYLANAARPAAEWGRALDVMTRPLTTSPLLLAAAWHAWRRQPADSRTALRPWLWYLGAAWAVGLATSANWGASWNYLLEPYLALVLMMAACQGGQPARRLLSWHAAYAVVIFGMVIFDVRGDARQIEEGAAAARSALAPELAAGRRIAVLDNDAALDELLALGGVSRLHLIGPGDKEQNRALARQALAAGELDLVLVGPRLEPLDPDNPSRPAQTDVGVRDATESAERTESTRDHP